MALEFNTRYVVAASDESSTDDHDRLIFYPISES